MQSTVATAPVFRILRLMRRERLKDQIEDPRVSLFDSFVRAVVVLISLGAVYYALSGRGFPVASQTVAPDAATGAILTATRDHQFYWDQEGPLPLAEARARLAGWIKTHPAPRVVIAADESALLGDTMALFNEARRQGVVQLKIEAQTRTAP